MARPLRDLRGIIHCHSRFSHDSKGTYEEILAAAKAAQIDFICMTDHPPKDDKGRPLREGWTGLHDGVLFIQGAEYGDQILALGIREAITGKDRRETIRAIHDQGGVAIACHPELIDDWDEVAEADGMEIYNVHATLQRKAKDKRFLAEVVKALKEDPEHSFHLLEELDPAIVSRWDEINRRRPFTGIAGNDAHQNVSFFGYQLDPYARAFRFVSTHVLAEDLSERGVLEALRTGRCYVQFMRDWVGIGGPGAFNWVGQHVAPGAWLAEPEARPQEGIGAVERRWYLDGRRVEPDRIRSVAEPEHGTAAQWTMRSPGNYRMEWVFASGAPLLLTNGVRFGSAAPLTPPTR